MGQSRKIIHIDMDCFYAAIEMRDNPDLVDKPIAVGGAANSRGVVATCNYVAREFGVHSALPMAVAKRRCPALITLPVRMNLYKEISQSIQQLFFEYTDLVEPLSLDEAFLDVSDSPFCNGSATLIAQQIRQRIESAHRLTASAGVAPNKFLAKVGSDWNKPNGQYVVRPDQVSDFVRDLPVKWIPGVGKATMLKMQEHSIETCRHLQRYSLDELIQLFGRFGSRLYDMSRGIDDRAVKTERIRKSLSVEDTFPQDLPNLESCIKQLPVLYEELERRYYKAQQHQKLAIKALFVKMRFHDFATTTVQVIAQQTDQAIYHHLFEQAWNRGARPVRLLGIGIQFHQSDAPEQLALPLLFTAEHLFP